MFQLTSILVICSFIYVTTFHSAQEYLISALQAQLASKSPFFRTSESEPQPSKSTHPPPNSTTSAIPQFLTRATADAEQHTLQDELERLRNELKANGALVKVRERRIGELEQSGAFFRIVWHRDLHMVMLNRLCMCSERRAH